MYFCIYVCMSFPQIKSGELYPGSIFDCLCSQMFFSPVSHKSKFMCLCSFLLLSYSSITSGEFLKLQFAVLLKIHTPLERTVWFCYSSYLGNFWLYPSIILASYSSFGTTLLIGLGLQKQSSWLQKQRR